MVEPSPVAANQTDSPGDEVTVCICTYKRPRMLSNLLAALERQAVDATFAFDVVVVDNDERRSAEATVREFARRVRFEIAYVCEPERNISLARNAAVRHARGRLLAFIDDDEWPCDHWLAQLVRTLRASKADGVLGPVLPDLPAEAPAWLRTTPLLQRPRHPTGTRISARDARTGNLLLDVSRVSAPWFDPAFGRTGGEDSDFFLRQFEKGSTFVWCDEAIAHEAVPPERWKAAYHLKRLWRAGTTDGEWMRDGRMKPVIPILVKNVVVLGLCLLALPFLAFVRMSARVRVGQKMAYCGGLTTAYLGLSLYRERE